MYRVNKHIPKLYKLQAIFNYMIVTNFDWFEESLHNPIKIGEGRFREVYQVGGYTLKVLKPYTRKNYGPFHIAFPVTLYTTLKFGIPDFNEHEYNTYNSFADRIPSELRESFYHIHGVQKPNGRSCLITELVADTDGKPSKRLSEHGKIADSIFWKQIKRLEEALLDEGIMLMDINGENILVRKTDNGPIPVIVDYKRLGGKTYPAQFWLSSGKQMEKKIQRRFQRLREQYSI